MQFDTEISKRRQDSKNEISESIVDIVRGLACNKTITHLEKDQCMIDDNGARALSIIMQVHTCLHTIMLSNQ